MGVLEDLMQMQMCWLGANMARFKQSTRIMNLGTIAPGIIRWCILPIIENL
ncbi:hypothetical protein [Helicobacter cinaedi]|nr:hypothetical protein [Helicobacter cinaedi]QOQ96271.1 hypothetical protein HW245_00860 [Helicobacter cinaedi]